MCGAPRDVRFGPKADIGGEMFKAGPQDWPGGHRLKEARRSVSLRTIEGLAENQEPESADSDTCLRWHILKLAIR
jgi:hypothetical protein